VGPDVRLVQPRGVDDRVGVPERAPHELGVRDRADQVGERRRQDGEPDGVGGADAGRGTGLRGLTDRVAVLDGTLAVDSPSGGGTRLHVEIPCAKAPGSVDRAVSSGS